MRRCLVRNLAKFAIGLACVSVQPTLRAQEPDATEPRFEITPFINYRGGGGFQDGATGDNIDLSGKAGFALAFNWPATEPGTRYELLYSRQKTDTDGSVPIDMTVEYLQIGGTAIIGDVGAHVVPFAAGGLGVARFSPGAASLSRETRFAFNLGGGVQVPVAKQVRLRFEVRGYLSWLNGNSNLFCGSDASGAGCAIQAKGESFFQYEALAGVSIGF